MVRTIALTLIVLCLDLAVYAQSDGNRDREKPPSQSPPVETGGPAGGPTGLFTVYDGTTIRRGEFTFSIAYSNYDRDPANVEITNVPLNFNVGLDDHIELFFKIDGLHGIKVNSPQNLSGYYLANSQLLFDGGLRCNGPAINEPAVRAAGPIGITKPSPSFRPAPALQFIPVVYCQPIIITSRITGSFVYDTRNASVDPTAGRELSVALAASGLGGDVRTYQPTVSYSQFRAISREKSEHPEVFGFRILAGTVGSFATRAEVNNSNSLAFVDGVPIFERFFLGDEFTIRGYNVRSINPGLSDPNAARISSSYTPIGADTQLLGNYEYRVPVTGSTVQLSTWPTSVQHSISGSERDQSLNSNLLRGGLGLFKVTVPERNYQVRARIPLLYYSVNNPFRDPTLGMFVWGRYVSEQDRQRIRLALKRGPEAVREICASYGADSVECRDFRAANESLGAEGVDNGVTLSVGPTQTVGAGAETSVASCFRWTKRTKDNPTGQRTIVTLSNETVNSDELIHAIRHEGSHVADGLKWRASGCRKSRNPFLYEAEFRAYTVASLSAQVYRPDAPFEFLLPGGGPPGKNPFLPEIVPIYLPDLKAEDLQTTRNSNIDKLLAQPKNAGGLYGVTSKSPGMRAFAGMQ